MTTSIPALDARQLLHLLWRSRRAVATRPGPRPRISVDDIVVAAIARADAHGLETLTMRDLAARLGVKPMALYAHIPDKGTLVALMIDAAMVTFDLPDTPGASFRERIAAVAEANLQLFLAHPWLLQTWSEQPPFGPGVVGKYERELAMLVPIGLLDVQVDAVLTYIIGVVRAAAADLVARRSASTTNDQWWSQVGPELAHYVTPDEFPLATRIGSAAGAAIGGAYNAEHAWRFSLERLLDGLEPLVRHASRT